jgi:hypothetical protein
MLENDLKNNRITLPEGYTDFLKVKSLCFKKNWNVYAKKPFANPDRVIEYLGKYTHRVAISNHRIISMDNNKVTFKCKDNRTGKYTQTITMNATEFIRRFLQHVLPCGFYKIRYMGIMALSCAKSKLETAYELMDSNERYLPSLIGLNATDVFREITAKDPMICPQCNVGHMKFAPLKLCV